MTQGPNFHDADAGSFMPRREMQAFELEVLSGIFHIDRTPDGVMLHVVREQWLGATIQFENGAIVVNGRQTSRGMERVPELKVPGLRAIEQLGQYDDPKKQAASRLWQAYAEVAGWDEATPLFFNVFCGSIVDISTYEEIKPSFGLITGLRAVRIPLRSLAQVEDIASATEES